MLLLQCGAVISWEWRPWIFRQDLCLASDFAAAVSGDIIVHEQWYCIYVPESDWKWLLGTCLSISCNFSLKLLAWEEEKGGFEEGKGKLFPGSQFPLFPVTEPFQSTSRSCLAFPCSQTLLPQHCLFLFVRQSSTAIFKQPLLHVSWCFEFCNSPVLVAV